MAGHGYDMLVKDALIFLFAVGVVVPVFRYLRLPSVVGFMVAGVLLGPFALGALTDDLPWLEYVSVSDPESAAPFAELGILFLLFLLGLEFSFEKLWSLRRAVFGAGGLQSGLSAAAIAGAVYWLGLPAEAAIICGLALALSSTAIVMQILIEQKRAARPVGRTALSVLLFQDILVAPILIFVGFLSVGESTSVSAVLIDATIKGLIAIAAIMLVGRFALRPVFRLAATMGGRDFLLALTLLTVVGAAAITASAGLSLALGAFLAGLLLGETEFKHQTEVDLEPFKGLLLGVFFMTVGMALDLPSLVTQPGVIFGGLAALLVAKFVIAFLACRLFAGDRSVAAETASLLAPAGEFAFVVIAAAGVAGVLDAGTSSQIAAIAVLSMLLIPVLGRLGAMAGARLEPAEPAGHADADYSEVRGHVIIAGFGRVGQAVARILDVEDTEIVALELSALRLAEARQDGWHVFLGDAARPEMLHIAGAEGARLFVVTVDDVNAAEAMVESFHRLHPDTPIVARARDHEHAMRLRAAGASQVIPDAIESGLQMAGKALAEFGYDSETVRSRLAAERDEEYLRV